MAIFVKYFWPCVRNLCGNQTKCDDMSLRQKFLEMKLTTNDDNRSLRENDSYGLLNDNWVVPLKPFSRRVHFFTKYNSRKIG